MNLLAPATLHIAELPPQFPTELQPVEISGNLRSDFPREVGTKLPLCSWNLVEKSPQSGESGFRTGLFFALLGHSARVSPQQATVRSGGHGFPHFSTGGARPTRAEPVVKMGETTSCAALPCGTVPACSQHNAARRYHLNSAAAHSCGYL